VLVWVIEILNTNPDTSTWSRWRRVSALHQIDWVLAFVVIAAFSEAVGGAGDKIAAIAACARNSVRVTRSEIEERIEHNPLTSVLIALAVGASIGLIIRHSRNKRMRE
jgi:hypothetical protein